MLCPATQNTVGHCQIVIGHHAMALQICDQRDYVTQFVYQHTNMEGMSSHLVQALNSFQALWFSVLQNCIHCDVH